MVYHEYTTGRHGITYTYNLVKFQGEIPGHCIPAIVKISEVPCVFFKGGLSLPESIRSAL